MSYRTNKCTHGDRGMCINCLVNKNRMQKKGQIPEEKQQQGLGCIHPAHMRCLRCLPYTQAVKQCNHPDYEKCKHCQHYIQRDRFSQHLQKLQSDCTHKKPCHKCVPALSRKTFTIDFSCKNHLPYPQAQCDACMAPTLTIRPQNYAHVSKVVIRTTAVYRIIDAQLIAILLGSQQDDVIYVDDVYFPEEQERGTSYLSPDKLLRYEEMFEFFGLRKVGLLYCSSSVNGMSLMLSSLFQNEFAQFDQGHQISKFVTMRLQMDSQNGGQPHFESYMVSDQFQALHRSNMVLQALHNETYFEFITSRMQDHTGQPTFLREGIQTDRIFFKQIIVWIETVSQENFNYGSCLEYPFFTVDPQTLQDFSNYIQRQGEGVQKYSNIQFVLHLNTICGRQCVMIFLREFLLDNSELFLEEQLLRMRKKQKDQLKRIEKGIVVDEF